MKRVKKLISLLSLLLVVVMFTGCLSVDMKVSKNGSLDMTYTIDTSQLQGMMSFEDIEAAVEESINNMNDSSDKKIAKLKSIKENKGKKIITAIIEVSDINKMGDDSFFGTVKDYRDEDGSGLDNLVNSKGRSVEEEKVSDKLQMVYFPMGGTEEYGLIEVTITVPGNIQYITDGGEITKKDTAVFYGSNPLIVFKKGGGFPFWLLILIAVGVVFFVMKKKRPVASPINVAPATGGTVPTQTPAPSVQFPAQAPVEAPVEVPVEAPVEAPQEIDSSAEPQADPTDDITE